MKLQKTVLIMLISILLAALMSCGDNGEKDEGKTEENSEMSKGHDESGEDSAAELGLDDTYDVKQSGARLVLKYDAESNSFIGTVTNLRGDMLENVRVEVHTSDGKEIGPSEPEDLKPGERRKIMLQAESTGFESWSAHVEVGRAEHGKEGEHN